MCLLISLFSFATIEHFPSSGLAPAKTVHNVRKQSGFTLLELVLVIMILGILGVGISSFMRTSVLQYTGFVERTQLINESSFIVQRINRELMHAVPNSIRITGDTSVHCLEFVPNKWATIYTTLPLQPSATNTVDVVAMQDINGTIFNPVMNTDFAIVYPVDSHDVYDLTRNKRHLITACQDDGADTSCATADDPDNIVELTVADSFAASSPASRLYIADRAVSYCVRDNNMYRHETGINTTQTAYTSGGIMIAQNIVNTLSDDPVAQTATSDDPFRWYDATYRRNAYSRVLLAFGKDEQVISFVQEVHIPNVP